MHKVRYILPATTDFRETRPRICWEHLYGWLEGYGTLFDPLFLAPLGELVPEWENGWNGVANPGDFFITACQQATAAFGTPTQPGVFIRPASGVRLLEQNRVSEKEGLRTPLGESFYPIGYNEPLRYDRYRDGDAAWSIGENPAVVALGNGAVAVAFELFGILEQLRVESPEQRLLDAAERLAALVGTATGTSALPTGTTGTADGAATLVSLRLDCQAYGMARLMVQWLLEKKGQSRDACRTADAAFLTALAAWRAGDTVAVRAALGHAFQELARIRQTVSKLRLFFLEFPHLGILTADKGWFELEWPHYARQTLNQYSAWVAQNRYQLSLEGGAACWRHLANRYPDTIAELRQRWEAGALELTNGTFTLPYSMVSPLLLQCWQFSVGHAAFREAFGRVPETYQAQEHALTPQMPELLRLFGYRQALHIAQNHGTAPIEERDFIRWQSPAGHGLPALAARHPSLACKGVNFYLDIPLVHAEFGGTDEEINYVNFMDFGFIPFRTQMIRAHQYASVFGAYATPAARFAAACPPLATLPCRVDVPDDYRFTPGTFYGDATNADNFSQPERIFSLVHGLRQAQFAAWLTGREAEFHPELAKLFPEACFQEAHDVQIVQDQRRGEFFKFNQEASPYARDTLATAAATTLGTASQTLAALGAAIGGAHAAQLLNAAESALSFARVRQPERFTGPSVRIAGQTYAIGDFQPWSSAAADDAALTALALPKTWGHWILHPTTHGLEIAHGGRTLEITIVDSLHGAMECVARQARAAGPLLAVELTCRSATEFVQTAVLDLLLTADGTLAEVNLRYAPGRAFSAQRRWRDYLALEIRTGSALRRVWRFNPNVRAETHENPVSSPYFLAVENEKMAPLSVLNEGSGLYHIDREAGTVRWLCHVADEKNWSRRLALAFATAEAFQLSRAWGQGLLPVATTPVRTPQRWLRDGWAGLSAEGFTADGRLLLSNLSATPAEFALTPAAPAWEIHAVDGTSRLNAAHQLTLNPCELALAQKPV